MMKIIYLLTVVLLVINVSSVNAGLSEISKVSCESLGYNTDVNDCSANNGIPLLCPFANTDSTKCVCILNSCRGYNLQDSDLEKLASDGKTFKQHIKNLSSCVLGYGNEEQTLYRVDECNEGSLYQNGLCDAGCDKINKYPYSVHPGNLAGKVISCTDTNGEYFGYEDPCNSGWTFSGGKCNLASCKVIDYPYNTNPNQINGVDRGLTKICRIGGNSYYRYTATDNNDNPLTSGGCEHNGFILLNAICARKCMIDNCTAIEQEVSYSSGGNTITKKYNEWQCEIKSEDCRIGDYAVFNNETVGTIFHLPDDVLDKVLIVAEKSNSGLRNWASGVAQSIDTPLENTYYDAASGVLDYDGKYKTNFLLNFAEMFNYTYPAANYAKNYTLSNCDHDICKTGEWYLPSMGELTLMYNQRYMMYNIAQSKSIYYPEFDVWTSNEGGDTMACHYDSNIRACWPKRHAYYAIPILSFTPK